MFIFLSIAALVSTYFATYASAATASDLPVCAVECYFKAMLEANVGLDDFEGQCRSGPFQRLMKSCAFHECEPEEYEFVNFFCSVS
jgi:CFEM domain